VTASCKGNISADGVTAQYALRRKGNIYGGVNAPQ
jgi:hypothetical protein